MKEQWRQQMQQKMADYQRPAPEVSWDAIDKALASNKPKAKAVPMWMRRIAAAIAVLAVATAGYLALDRNHEELSRGGGLDHPVSSANGITQFATPHSQRENRPHHPESQQTKDEPVAVEAKTPQTSLLATVTPKSQSTKVDEQNDEAQAVKTVDVQEEPSTPQTQESQPQKARESQETNHSHSVVEAPKRQTLDYPSEVRPRTTAESRLMAKVYLSNGLASSNSNSMFGYNTLANATIDKKYSGETQNTIDIPAVKHHQPVRFGLSLRYRLNDRWSIESGLAYTRLRSDLKWRSGAEAEQTLSYVGIPVSANYLLWGSRYVNFYVSAGGLVEKMVKGHLETTYKGSIQKENVSIHPLQFSLSGGIGAEFNLTNQFSIYAEPDVGYYFGNGSTVPTYYQDKPFSFNLNLGLRFNLK